MTAYLKRPSLQSPFAYVEENQRSMCVQRGDYFMPRMISSRKQTYHPNKCERNANGPLDDRFPGWARRLHPHPIGNHTDAFHNLQLITSQLNYQDEGFAPLFSGPVPDGNPTTC